MYQLNRLILIDSYKPGELLEVRLDGHTNLNGVNGAGKTTLLRLVPLFFGERPGRLVPKSKVTDSFAKHYLPNESSYIIFEYQRHEQTCMVLIYAASNDDGVCYRFVDKGFVADDFIETRRDGSYPVSCRNLRSHFLKRHINCSDQLTACSDYRTVIQNLPHKKGQELRQWVARYSFCNGSVGHRLKDIEKIVTGMFMRSTDFADLREMLVNCIEEDRDAIVLEVQMETLDSWHKEYRAYQDTEAERDKEAQLQHHHTELQQVAHSLSGLLYRWQCLRRQNEQELEQKQAQGNTTQQDLQELSKAWDDQESKLKLALAEIKAELELAERQKTALETEQADWDKQDIPAKTRLLASLAGIKDNLQRSENDHRQLLDAVQDIDAEFKRLKAEKEQGFASRQHSYELAIRDIRQQLSDDKAQAQHRLEQQKDTLRETSQHLQDQHHAEQLQLQSQRGALNSQLADIQPDPALLENRDTKQEQLAQLQQQKQAAETLLHTVEADIRHKQTEIDTVLRQQQQHADTRQQCLAQAAQLQQQLDANPQTLLGFLREQQPAWTTTIAKVINPDLLLREDLEPVLHAATEHFYGVSVNLDVLVADHAADEEHIRALLLAVRDALNALAVKEAQAEASCATLKKQAEELNKRLKAEQLIVGQFRKQITGLNEELASLKLQIERSKKQRKTELVQQQQVLDERIQLSNTQLQQLKAQLNAELRQLSLAHATTLQQLDHTAAAASAHQQTQIEQLKQQQQSELAALEQQRLHSLRERKIDTATLTGLENAIKQLRVGISLAEQAELTVKDYQRWLERDWSRYEGLLKRSLAAHAQLAHAQNQYETEQQHYQQQRHALKQTLERVQAQLHKLGKDLNTIDTLVDELRGFVQASSNRPHFDHAHTLAFLQAEQRQLVEQHKTLRKQMAALLRHLKQVLARFPDTHPGRYYAQAENEVGFDGNDLAWLQPIQVWYGSRCDEARSWLMSQAKLFGSGIRNYQQALERFDRGIVALSSRLAKHIDGNVRFEKIDKIEGRLSSKVTTLGYWEQIVSFTKNYDEWGRAQDGQLPSADFADIVRLVSEQLHGKGKVEMKLVNLLELEIIVTENNRSKRATHAEELRQISSHGLSYLILCVFFIALVNMIRKGQPVNIIWPMDELKELHQTNIEVLVEMLGKNQITLLSAFPDPDPEVLKLFKNRYQVFGFRQLIEMDVDEGYVSTLPALTVGSHV